ncbi:MAG: hypothetical protein ACKV2T_10825 [Kofleriaceae bacterium]
MMARVQVRRPRARTFAGAEVVTSVLEDWRTFADVETINTYFVKPIPVFRR